MENTGEIASKMSNFLIKNLALIHIFHFNPQHK